MLINCMLRTMCIQDLMSRIEMLEEDRTEIIKEFENLQKIMASLENENKVSVFFLLLLYINYTLSHAVLALLETIFC